MQRFGIGYDIHRLIAGRRLVLGGIHIEHARGLDGHSDADVVAHAIMDALLGAAAMGDIGRYFPPSDPAYRDADSMMLLSQVRRLLGQQGWKPCNVDVTVVAERPHLQPHIKEMRTRLARALGLEARDVNVKATTNEGLGPEGREEGISALAVASIVADRVEEHREHSPDQHPDRQEGDLFS